MRPILFIARSSSNVCLTGVCLCIMMLPLTASLTCHLSRITVKITIAGVAREAGVSSQTVSRVIYNKVVELAPATRLYTMPRHPYTEALLSAVHSVDPERASKRIILTGDMPNPANPPAGCVFHPRCRYATEICKTQVPQWRELGANHGSPATGPRRYSLWAPLERQRPETTDKRREKMRVDVDRSPIFLSLVSCLAVEG